MDDAVAELAVDKERKTQVVYYVQLRPSNILEERDAPEEAVVGRRIKDEAAGQAS